MPNVLEGVAAYLSDQADANCGPGKVPGYLAGVYHDGGQAIVAYGIANEVTSASMREDTGFPFGSVTKVLTATLVLQQAERGAVDLDERVVTYVPEFKLTTRGAGEQIRDQQRIFTAFSGGSVYAPPRRYASIGKDLFAPAEMPLEAFSGYMRLLLVSYHSAGGGRPAYRCAGGCMTRRDNSC